MATGIVPEHYPGGWMAFDLGSKAESALDGMLGLVVILALVGGTIALVFTNLGDVIAAFASPDTGSVVLDGILPTLGLVVGIIVSFGVVRRIRAGVED